MQKVKFTETRLLGLALKSKTTNENGQSTVDCGNLWQTFGANKIADKIPGKMSDEIFAVYHSYDGDHTMPFSYFIGCKVKPDTHIPNYLDHLMIPSGIFTKVTAKGKMPECIADAWREIWISKLSRSYELDFEVYDQRSRNWSNAEVDIYISTPG